MTAIEHINTAIAEHELALSTLRALKANIELDNPDSGHEENPCPALPGNSEGEDVLPMPKTRKPKAAKASALPKSGSWREKLLEILANGPQTASQIVAQAGVGLSSFSTILKSSPNFEKMEGNKRSPWRLTALGREAARSAGIAVAQE